MAKLVRNGLKRLISGQLFYGFSPKSPLRFLLELENSIGLRIFWNFVIFSFSIFRLASLLFSIVVVLVAVLVVVVVVVVVAVVVAVVGRWCLNMHPRNISMWSGRAGIRASTCEYTCAYPKGSERSNTLTPPPPFSSIAANTFFYGIRSHTISHCRYDSKWHKLAPEEANLKVRMAINNFVKHGV